MSTELVSEERIELNNKRSSLSDNIKFNRERFYCCIDSLNEEYENFQKSAQELITFLSKKTDDGPKSTDLHHLLFEMQFSKENMDSSIKTLSSIEKSLYRDHLKYCKVVRDIEKMKK